MPAELEDQRVVPHDAELEDPEGDGQAQGMELGAIVDPHEPLDDGDAPHDDELEGREDDAPHEAALEDWEGVAPHNAEIEDQRVVPHDAELEAPEGDGQAQGMELGAMVDPHEPLDEEVLCMQCDCPDEEWCSPLKVQRPACLRRLKVEEVVLRLPLHSQVG